MTGFGKLGGVTGEELILMESEFLDFVDYNLMVDTETFNEYVKAI
jgi:hypothetical protein